jgi:hypothetical protein
MYRIACSGAQGAALAVASGSAANGLASAIEAICANCGRESKGEFRFCPYCAAPLVSAAPTREQRKTVTVLFCDVTGSTALGESMDPEALRALLARYFEHDRPPLGRPRRRGGFVRPPLISPNAPRYRAVATTAGKFAATEADT